MKTDETIKYAEVLNKYDHLHLTNEEILAKLVNIKEKYKSDYEDISVTKFILSCIDHSSLNSTDSSETILNLTEKINDFYSDNPDIPTLASLCIFPNYASLVSSSLEIEDIKVSCVTGGFPTSQTFSEIKTVETSLAINDGADEIDFVMPVGSFLSTDYSTVVDQITEIKAICHDHKLKVILETGLLGTDELIRKATLLAIYSGADFVKTTSGKCAPFTTPSAVYIMCKTIKAYYEEFGKKMGIKIAGGLKTYREVVDYYSIVKSVLGKEWLTPELFRIGTSKVTKQIIELLTEKESQL